ncbi:MAG: ComEA family DNA-binding protein [Bacteroidota bacterium]
MDRRLFQLQQKLGITKPEATAIAILSILFLMGIGVRQCGDHATPLATSSHLRVDSLLTTGAERLAADFATVEQVNPAERSSSPAAPEFPVDINMAGASDLQRLPRIGPAIAERILEHRQRYGPFRSIEDLMAVRGIGPRTMESLRPMIVAGRPDSL